MELPIPVGYHAVRGKNGYTYLYNINCGIIENKMFNNSSLKLYNKLLGKRLSVLMENGQF